ncbi:MAG: 16S rRNA (guanine(527)-N(7))-methyltransferase RsmG [Deltaproteobacteria bacterium]|jgi:16S rRNA (guanine527-N7)-methyltransferase|nr:16S rRNA (guanine(527)-N(7))-methyltransferase RsmG [Deltaproteobacteria bacterium]
MLPSDVEDFLALGLELMGLHLPEQAHALDRLALYFQELKKWNRKINLVARNLDDRQILEKHFLDSLTLLSIINPENQAHEKVLDVGTGAGFPGLVLKTVCPKLEVVLIEPRRNRYYFLKQVVRMLGLEGVELLNDRLEKTAELQELSGRKFTLITSRAFTDINQFIELSLPYLALEGRIVCMKGPHAEKELNFLRQRGMAGNLIVSEIKKLRLPFSKAERLLLALKISG